MLYIYSLCWSDNTWLCTSDLLGQQSTKKNKCSFETFFSERRERIRCGLRRVRQPTLLPCQGSSQVSAGSGFKASSPVKISCEIKFFFNFYCSGEQETCEHSLICFQPWETVNLPPKCSRAKQLYLRTMSIVWVLCALVQGALLGFICNLATI